MSRASPVKRWVFTLFEYTDDEFNKLKESLIVNCDYCIIGEELCPTTNKPHLQGYVCFKSRIRFNQAKERINTRAHIEPSKGSPKQNFKYCSKSGKFWEHGEMPRYGGGSSSSRSNRIETSKTFIQKVSEGVSLAEIMEDMPDYVLFHGSTMLNNYYMTFPAISRPNIKVFWLYGPTGIGKSTIAHELMPNAYIKDNSSKWFHQYRLEKEVIIDDLDGNLPIAMLLTWLDRFRCVVETKGSTIPLYADKWIITSNYSPGIYGHSEAMLTRRCKVFKLENQEDCKIAKFNIMTELFIDNNQ